MTLFEEKWKFYEKAFLQDLQKLVSIPSVREIQTARQDAPFGTKIRNAFDCFLEIAKKCGLETHDIHGYACDARLGDADAPYIGVLGHLDVVEAGDSALWHTDPFSMHIDENQILYGRGVNDDKGPLLTCLYVVRIMKDLGIPCPHTIRVIAGGAEETTWECMHTYFAHEPQPMMGFSPDGNFPIVNGEKGIRKYDILFSTQQSLPNRVQIHKIHCATLENYVCDTVTITMKPNDAVKTFFGVRALSRNPQRGENALLHFAKEMRETEFGQPEINHCLSFLHDCFLQDTDGTGCGIVSHDAEMGDTSICPTGLEQKTDGIHLYVDVRYPRSTTPEILDTQFHKLAAQYNFSFRISDEKKLLYISTSHPLVKALSQAYESVTGQPAECFTKGGASYARTMNCGIAFGATFPDEHTYPHMPNECMSLHTIRTAAKIYYEALTRLGSTRF